MITGSFCVNLYILFKEAYDMKSRTKRKLFFLAVDALLVAAILIDFSSDKDKDEIVDDAACE